MGTNFGDGVRLVALFGLQIGTVGNEWLGDKEDIFCFWKELEEHRKEVLEEVAKEHSEVQAGEEQKNKQTSFQTRAPSLSLS